MSTSHNKQSALLQRPPEQPIAHLTSSLNQLNFDSTGLQVSQTQFLNHVNRLAQVLPDHDHAINLCQNRYLFMVSLCAVIVRKATNLLPPNKNTSTQSQLCSRYSNCIVLHDGSVDIAQSATAINVSTLNWSLDSRACSIPNIALDHLAAISFTSGSTGESKPNIKYWRTIVESSRINAQHMLVSPHINHAHLATVPGQHMWGFETSVLIPMFANASLVDAQPFFPHDIVQLVNTLPNPCTLISAPLHLKALSHTLTDTKNSIKLASILCATAPLDRQLATTLEQQTQSELREVYGCSEVGSMSVRNTSKQSTWQPFIGLKFKQKTDNTTVSAGHLPQSITLEDTLVFQEDGHFTLAGRSSDQIKIAGKRGSLTEVNAVLNRFSGLKDGVVIFPEQPQRAVPRLVALVSLHNNADKTQLRTHMATYLDSVFVPRPIFLVDALPREENGKLSKAKIQALYEQLNS